MSTILIKVSDWLEMGAVSQFIQHDKGKFLTCQKDEEPSF